MFSLYLHSQTLIFNNRRRGLLNLGGAVLKTLFGTATISDIQEIRSVFDDLQTKNADIVH